MIIFIIIHLIEKGKDFVIRTGLVMFLESEPEVVSSHPQGLALDQCTKGCYNRRSDGDGNKRMFQSSSPSVRNPEHPFVQLSRVAGTTGF